MAQVINTNIASLNAQRNLNRTGNELNTALQRLSTGLRINSAKDDAAGLAIAERFTAQIRGLNQAVRNANDGISFAQTAEGALGTVNGNLQRIRELAVQSVNDTNSSSDRAALNNEVTQLIAEVNRVSASTQFNGQSILDGTLGTLTFQVGANQNQTIQVTGVDARGSQLGARISEAGSVDRTAIDALIAADDLVVNGAAVDLSGLAAGDSVNSIVNAINNVQATSGVQASVATTVSTGTDLTYGAPAADTVLTINNVQISIATATVIADAATLIDSFSAQTGVSAVSNGTEIVLSNTSGSDIVITEGVDDVLGIGNATTETYSAGLVLASEVRDTDFTAAGTYTQAAGETALGASQANETVSNVSVSTGALATSAIRAIDFALQQVNGLRSELGSVQTRFESTIGNLEVVSENLSASRSRIQDADFAAETAALTRAQILQQAGVAILSQANALPQTVLSLLQ